MARIKACMKREMVAMREGKRLGKPADILLDLEEHRVALVVLAKSKVPQLFVVAPRQAIQSFNAATLPLGGISDACLACSQPLLLEIIERDLHMRGRDVLTSGGAIVGQVIDVELDENGNVQEYRVRRNLLDRLLMRTHPVLPSDLKTAGQEVAIVDAPTEPATLEDKPSGGQLVS